MPKINPSRYDTEYHLISRGPIEKITGSISNKKILKLLWLNNY